MNTIKNEDGITGMNALPAGSADLVFADPPFNIGYKYDVYKDKRNSGDYLTWSGEWMRAAFNVLSPSGSFWLAIGDEYAAELSVLAKSVGFTQRSWVVWYYTFGVNCKRGFSRSHTHLFHFVKDPENFTFNGPSIAVPSARSLVYNDKRANPAGRLPDNTWILRPQEIEMSSFDDTWHVPRVAGTHKERQGFHGCQMPEAVLERIVNVSSNAGDLVIDPFSGSATTLAVAKRLERRFLGFDISSEYVTHGLERLGQ